MIIALAMSTKNAETKGSTMNAIGDGPYRCVTAFIFAIAVGVAPKAKPAAAPEDKPSEKLKPGDSIEFDF